jgi:hypothetical protein
VGGAVQQARVLQLATSISMVLSTADDRRDSVPTSQMCTPGSDEIAFGTTLKIIKAIPTSCDVGPEMDQPGVCKCVGTMVPPAETGDAEQRDRWFGRSPRYDVGPAYRSVLSGPD